MTTDYQKIIDTISEEIQPFFGIGQVADYIPALSKVQPRQFGMAIRTVDGQEFTTGAAKESFSAQSIAKVFTLTMAMNIYGEKIWERLGRDPSGSSFNSLVQLEYENGIPRNPFINAGALVITDLILEAYPDAKSEILKFVRNISGNQAIYFDEEVAQSEKEHGFRNAALVNFIKSYGNIKNDAEIVLDTYFHLCSLAMSCEDLSRAFVFLASEGRSTYTNSEIVTEKQAKRLNALLLTCGMYDAVGEFAYLVGLPAKSGVGGGITAIVPKEMAITVWSPELNHVGNSLVGTKALELFTHATGKSIF